FTGSETGPPESAFGKAGVASPCRPVFSSDGFDCPQPRRTESIAAEIIGPRKRRGMSRPSTKHENNPRVGPAIVPGCVPDVNAVRPVFPEPTRRLQLFRRSPEQEVFTLEWPRDSRSQAPESGPTTALRPLRRTVIAW